MLSIYRAARWIVACWGLQVLFPLCWADPCTDYTPDDTPNRSVRNNVTANSTLLCDLDLPLNWYRFTSGAGGEMPTFCPPLFSCGTHDPIWLNGTHPVVSDGEVNRTACVHQPDLAGSDCCGVQVHIRVRNCSGFYVYYLTSPPGCDMAYCAGSEAPCPAGTTSSNADFTPGCSPIPGSPTGETNTAAVIVPVLCIVFMLMLLGGGLILYKGKRYGRERGVHVTPIPVRKRYSVTDE